MNKVCSQCKIEKEASQFWKSTYGKNGLHPYCKSCGQKYNKGYPKKLERAKKYRPAEAQKYRDDSEFRKKVSAQRKQYRTDNLVKLTLRHSKRRASEKGWDFNIDESDLPIPEFCPILNIKLNTTSSRKKGYDTPSLDRVDNTKGYIKGNVAIISDLANTMKNNATIEQLKLFSRNIETYLDKFQ